MTREELLEKAKPILFNGEMVRAILAGRKTVTRRCIKHNVDSILNSPYHMEHPETEDKVLIEKLCQPPYQPRDYIYVRETWQHLWELDENEQIVKGTEKYYYAATDTIPFDTYVDSAGVTHNKTPWRPSIHMPKKAARIFLKVKNVHAERLRDISGGGILKEGIPEPLLFKGPVKNAFDKFAEIWDSTIKKSDIDHYGWEANPWVWVIEFKMIEPERMEREN